MSYLHGSQEGKDLRLSQLDDSFGVDFNVSSKVGEKKNSFINKSTGVRLGTIHEDHFISGKQGTGQASRVKTANRKNESMSESSQEIRIKGTRISQSKSGAYIPS